MVWLPEGEKKSEDMFTHFNRILKRDGQTDGRTDRRTRLCIASRGKKQSAQSLFSSTEKQHIYGASSSSTETSVYHYLMQVYRYTSITHLARCGMGNQ